MALEISRLVDIDMLIRTKGGMHKHGSDVGLGRNKVEPGGQNHHGVNGHPLDNWYPIREEIDAFDLHVTSHTESGLEFLG